MTTKKIYFATRPEAQDYADRIHADMIANDPAYAKSVEAGQTKRWAIPAQDLDENDQPIDSQWYVVVKDRCMDAVRAEEIPLLKDPKWREQPKEAAPK